MWTGFPRVFHTALPAQRRPFLASNCGSVLRDGLSAFADRADQCHRRHQPDYLRTHFRFLPGDGHSRRHTRRQKLLVIFGFFRRQSNTSTWANAGGRKGVTTSQPLKTKIILFSNNYVYNKTPLDHMTIQTKWLRP
ncbi:hypothetical protein Btru_055287 [Bulinus truncatus]|nr:hypothetical protein Btru_055287 [Bulinus truncatus]